MDGAFEHAWWAARFNVYYLLAHLAGFWGVAVSVAAALCIRRTALRIVCYGLVLLLCFAAVCYLTTLGIQRKWTLRVGAARTEQQMMQATTRDGANLVFAPIVGAVKGMLYVTAGLAAAVTTELVKKRRRRRRNGASKTGKDGGQADRTA